MQIKQITKKDGSIVYRANVYLGVDKVTGKDVKTSITGRTKKEVKQKTKEAEIAFFTKWFYQIPGFKYCYLQGTSFLMVGKLQAYSKT